MPQMQEKLYRPIGLSDASWRAVLVAKAVADTTSFSFDPDPRGRPLALIEGIVEPVMLVFAEGLRAGVADGAIPVPAIGAEQNEFLRALCDVVYAEAGALELSRESFENWARFHLDRSFRWFLVHREKLAEIVAAITNRDRGVHAAGATPNGVVPVIASRRKQVDEYLARGAAATGLRIIKADLWRAAGYSAAREFEKWQSGDSSNQAADDNFRRVLADDSFAAAGAKAKERIASRLKR